jgi:lipoic acid synthetase
VAGGQPAPPAEDEPARVAEAVAALDLKHVVITSVTRDDLPDGGAGHFAATIRAVRQRRPACRIEVLTPDFGGDQNAVAAVCAARPTVYNHNLETVPRLYPAVRPRADYRRSLDLLAAVRRLAPSMLTKSGLMVGLGEREEEVFAVLADLRAVDCRIVTIGQYLAPSQDHLPVVEYVEPARFARWKERAESMGFAAVAAGPFVRSSHNAEAVAAAAMASLGGNDAH